jgi:Fe-S oxidoreductase
MTRVFDICHGCRLCFNLCPSFPSMLGFIDSRDGNVGAMTTAEQDQVVDECYQCKLCYLKCPYVPPHEWQLDFPRLMMRAKAVRKANGLPVEQRLTDQVMNRTDLVGRMSSAMAPLVDKLIGTPGSVTRRAMQAVTGMASERMLPPYSKERFTTWFRRRRAEHAGYLKADPPQASVTVFPTCFIEYMEPAIGKDLVRVYEHNHVACSLPAGTRCCGAPWLHSGDVEHFMKSARRNVEALVHEVRAGNDIVVAQPTCAYVVRHDYPLYLGTRDAEDVAAHTFDPAEYLMRLHRGEGTSIDTEFPAVASGSVPTEVTYHLACHLRAQSIGFKSRDLLKLAGIKADMVQQCSGIDGTWGYRARNYEMALKVAGPLMREVEKAGNEVVCGDCHLANGAILEQTGKRPLHPMQLVARAYGIEEDGTA